MEKRQMSGGPVEVLGKVLLTQRIHLFSQLVCQLECEHIDELLLFPGIRLVLFAGDMFSLSMFLVTLWALLLRASRLRSMAIGT